MVTRLQLLAWALSDGNWHSNAELVKRVGHRFGAQLLQLRTGKLDNKHWNVQKRVQVNTKGGWEYQFVGFSESYEPDSPTCPNCGTKLHVRDDRK